MCTKKSFYEFERTGWEKAANYYDPCWSGLTELFVHHLLSSTGLGQKELVLDLACGPGYVARAADQLGAEAVGLDFSPRMIRIACTNNPPLFFLVGDAENLPFLSGSFDVVAMNFGVPHLFDPEEAFSEVGRVLRSGGRLAFTVWADPPEVTGWKIVADAIKMHGDPNIILPEGPPFFRFNSPDECRSALLSKGFDDSTFSFRTVNVEWIVPQSSSLFDAEKVAGVRTAAALALQPQDRLVMIRDAIQANIESFASPQGYRIPMSAHIVGIGRS